jgi:hypothetical protein
VPHVSADRVLEFRNRCVQYPQHELEADEEMAGATSRRFALGKGPPLKLFLNGRQSALSMHGTAELGTMKRQLGLK